VNEEEGMIVMEPDGFVNEYSPVEADRPSMSAMIGKIIEAKKKEDVKYTGKASGKGDDFYKEYKRKLQDDSAFFKRQQKQFFPAQTKISKSGRYVSRERGTTYLDKKPDGYVRTTETGRVEEYNARGLLRKITDRNDNVLTFSYNDASRLERVTDGCGQFLQISYTPVGKIKLIRDYLLREMTYEYDSANRLIAAVSMDGEKTQFEYDKSNRMTAILFSDGAKTEMTYDPKTGYVTKQTGPGKKVTNYQYGHDGDKFFAIVTDNEGLKNRYDYINSEDKIVFTDKSGKKTITTVSACCGKPIAITDEKGVGDRFTYDEKGNLISKTNALKQVTTYKYEARFNLPEEIKAHDGSYLRYIYDKKGNLAFSKSSTGEYVKITHEKHGKLETLIDHKEQGIRFEYNRFGKPTLIEKTMKGQKTGSILVTYTRAGDIQKVDYLPKSAEAVQDIKNTLASFLRMLRPSGIDFEI
jgi:YD repeat-containing protein